MARDTTYTILDHLHAEVIAQGLSLSQAIHELLTHDGGDYTIKLCEELDNDGTYYRAYIKSYRDDKWNASDFTAFANNQEEAEQKINELILADHRNWDNEPTIYTDYTGSDYQKMLSEHRRK